MVDQKPAPDSPYPMFGLSTPQTNEKAHEKAQVAVTRIERTIIVHRSHEMMFAALLDFASTPGWKTSLSKEWSIPAVPIDIGTEIHQIYSLFGLRVKSIGKIVMFEMNQQMVVQATGGTFPVLQTSYELTAKDTSTQLTYAFDIKNQGFAGFAAPLVKRFLTKELATSCRMLKDRMEWRLRG